MSGGRRVAAFVLEEPAGHFDEASLRATPIRDLGLRIESTRLEPIIHALLAELTARKIDEVIPRFYLSTEWGVAFGTIAIANKPLPFDRRFVRHLPGWYAQKHPDEDWAETFAVWLTPGLDWRREYSNRPDALAKVSPCDRLLADYGQRSAAVQDDSRDEEVSELRESLDAWYSARKMEGELLPQTLDSALQTIFAAASLSEKSQPASELMMHLELPLLANVYRWTGHFPERTRHLIHHLVARADALSLQYQEENAQPLTVAMSTFIAALAMKSVHKGSYTP